MSRRHSGLVTSAVTLKTLRFHHLNSHVKQRLHAACTNTSQSVLTVLTLISKHYTSIGCLFLVIWSKSVRTLSLTLAPARSGQIGSVSPPQASVSLRSRPDLTQISQKSSPRTPLKPLKVHSKTPSHTQLQHPKTLQNIPCPVLDFADVL